MIQFSFLSPRYKTRSSKYFTQDFHWCSPTASACYTAVGQHVLGLECGVSCTGLYADVAFTEDNLLKIKGIPFSAAATFGVEVTIKHVAAKKGNERQKLVQLLKKYTDYKNSFVKQIRFDPRLSNLSEYIYILEFKLCTYIVHQPPPLTTPP